MGVGGVKLTAEQKDDYYQRCELFPAAEALGAAARLEGPSLWNRAHEFQSCYPSKWRHLLVDDLRRRARGDFNKGEKIDLGWARSPTQRIEELRGLLDAALEASKVEDQIPALERTIFAVKTAQKE